ncbi:MAG: sigma-70 family RNA polymerase sigma factor [Planctomycetota bacterium]
MGDESLRRREALPDEASLVDLACTGNRGAFEGLVSLYQDRLQMSMMQLTGNSHDAEEVTQEAFIRAFIKLDTFQRHSQFFTWLYRIAFNIALTRKRRHRVRYSLDQHREEAGVEVPADGEDVDANLVRNDDVNLVRMAMEKLTPQHRAILVLREMNEASYEDIAEVLELSIGTVRSRLNRARRQLRIALEEMMESESD